MSHPRPTSPIPVVAPPTYECATRIIAVNPLSDIEDNLRRQPFAVKGQRAIRLLDVNDASAAMLVLALVHDCFIFTNQLHLGQIPEDAFSLRRRLLSLYIVENDIMEFEEALRGEGLQYRYRVITDLLALRQRTLFADDLRPDENRGMDQRHELSSIIGRALMEPARSLKDEQASSFSHLLRRVRDSIESEPTGPEAALKLCNDARAFFKLAPCIPSTQQVTEITPTRKLELILDIFVALSVMYDCRPHGADSSTLYVSLGNDPPDGLYLTSCRLTRQFLLARDVVCHLLPGPCTLQQKGGYEQYVKPLLRLKDEWYPSGRKASHSWNDVRLNTSADYKPNHWWTIWAHLSDVERAFKQPLGLVRVRPAWSYVDSLAKCYLILVLPEHYVPDDQTILE